MVPVPSRIRIFMLLVPRVDLAVAGKRGESLVKARAIPDRAGMVTLRLRHNPVGDHFVKEAGTDTDICRRLHTRQATRRKRGR